MPINKAMNPPPLRGSLARKERSLGAGYRQAVMRTTWFLAPNADNLYILAE